MSDQTDLNPEELQTQRMLRTLHPAEPALTLRQIEWERQRRRLRRQLWTWRAAAAVLVVGLGVSMVIRPAPQEHVVERVVHMSDPAPLPPPPTPAYADYGLFTSPAPARGIDPHNNYFVLRELVLEHGLDALPERFSTAPADTRVPRVSDSLLDINGGGV